MIGATPRPPLYGTWERARRAARADATPMVMATCLAAVTLVSRVPFAGRYLFDWDSLQFALGIQRFDLAAHRPHPPGYVGYLALSRVAGLLTGNLNSGMVLLSMIAEALAVGAILVLGTRIHGRFAGVAAALLLLTSPLFWLYGETALTYGLEPGLALVAFWAARRAAASGRGMVALGLLVGLSGAIRPSAEFFLLPMLAVAAWPSVASGGRRGAAFTRAILTNPVWPALAVGTLAWLLPLLVLSGGPRAYLVASAQLGARVSAGSAVWRAGAAGLAVNSKAVLSAMAMSLGLFAPLALGAAVVGGREPLRRLATGWSEDRTNVLLLAWIIPALLTFLLVHIGQLAYVLFFLPALLLAAGPALGAIANLLREVGVGRRFTREAMLGACCLANVATFLLPTGSLAHLVADRDGRVAALITAVRIFPVAGTVLLADPEGPGSYRTAMYYLPEYRVAAVGRDRLGRAGEMFANHGGAPEYSLERFDRVGRLDLHGSIVVVLDQVVLASIADPQWLTAEPLAGRPGEAVYVGFIDNHDPPATLGPWIYLRSSDVVAHHDLPRGTEAV